MPNSNRVYFKNLDSLRFFAALSVILYHFTIHFEFPQTGAFQYLRQILSFNYQGGEAGVNFFFTLSGFLITYLLFVELQRNGKLNISHFYLRRVLRIWPLYFISIFIGFIVFPLIVRSFGGAYMENGDPTSYSFFLTNFDHLWNGYPSTGLLGTQWSVAIEEQFYLVWPLFLLLLGNLRAFPVAIIGLIGFSNIYRGWHLDNEMVTYFHTITAVNDLALGALLAWVSFNYQEKLIQWLSAVGRIGTAMIYLIGFGWLFFKYPLVNYLPIDYNYRLVASLFFGYVILEQTFSNASIFKLGRIKVFSSLGRISYGLYLLHMVPVTALVYLNYYIEIPLVVNMIIALAATILLSQLSYRWVERPFLVLKRRFTPQKSLPQKTAPQPQESGLLTAPQG